MGVSYSGSSNPIQQMISQDDDTIIISRWLENLVRSTGTPKELVIESDSLLLASVKAFTQFVTTDDYLNRCHLLLEGADHLQIPTCYIRQDVFDFVNKLERCTIFKSERSKVKKFYLSTIALLLKIDAFDEMKKIIEDLLIMAGTEFESIETEMSRKRLNMSIETHSIENIFIDINCDSNSEDDVLENSSENLLEICNTANKQPNNWFQEIKNKVLNLNHNRDEEKDNFFFFPNFLPFLENLIYKVPTWGAIMNFFFNSPNLNVSSSNCEPEFKYVQRNLFKNIEPASVDKFLLQHVRDLIGKMILVVSELSMHQHNIFYYHIF